MERLFAKRRFLLISVAAALLALFAVACGGDDDDPTATPAPDDNGSANGGTNLEDLSGDVAVDGSSTVFPITEAVAEEFRKVAPDVRVTVGVSGTGGGFEKFCAGETDISDASRPIKDSEREACAENDIEFVEVLVGLDGLAVVTSTDNDFLTDGVTTEQLATIFGAPSEGEITKWNQVDPSWPDEDIDIYAPDTDSGTFDFFNEEITEDIGGSRADYTASTDDNVLVVGISGDDNTIGYFGYAYYAENQGSLQVIPVNGVIPTDETVADGSYVLSRPLYIYVRIDSLQEKEQVREFVRFYLSDEAIPLVGEVGYTAVTTAEIEASRDVVEQAIAGEMVASDPMDDGDEVDLASLSGDVAVDGSSTVFPITEAVAEEFRKVAPDVRVTVGVSGTGGGFEKFCAGETDISDASRPIKDSEREACAGNDIDFIEVLVGLDGLAVVTSTENDFLVDGLTTEQLATIFGAPSEGEITKWNQVDESWPDEDIDIYAPDTDSGTFDFFNEEITEDIGGSRADYTASTDDNVLVVGISGDDNTIGYFGYAYFAENQDRLQVIPINGVVPTNETVADGSYVLSRPLFIYVREDSLRDKEQVREFVRFYLSDEAIPLVGEVGYTAVTTAEIEASRGVVEDAIAS